MSKRRSDYEKTPLRRFYHWVEGDAADLSTELSQDASCTCTTEAQEAAGGVRAEAKGSARAEERRQRRLQAAMERDRDLKDAARVLNVRDAGQLLRLYETHKDWPQTRGVKLMTLLYRIASVLICLCIIAVLLVTVSYLPEFGNPDNPNNNEVPARYIENGLQETGAVNVVAGMILDYRAFDTLGESHVLFIAACCVIILLRLDQTGSAFEQLQKNDRVYEPKHDIILQQVARILVPIIFIFGIYVILNGHLSPGGGFSGGAIIGAGLILYLNAFGTERIQRFFKYRTFATVTLCGLLFYASAKCYSFFTGANHLESGIPIGTPGAILSAGLILPLNICVGVVVACTMYGFFSLFRRSGI